MSQARCRGWLALVLATVLATVLAAQAAASQGAKDTTVVVWGDSITGWRQVAQGDPHVEIADLAGRSTAPGPFVSRIRLRNHPSGIAQHSHRGAVTLTVLSGKVAVFLYPTPDRMDERYLSPGDFVSIPAGVSHAVDTYSGDVVLQVAGVGPLDFTYARRLPTRCEDSRCRDMPREQVRTYASGWWSSGNDVMPNCDLPNVALKQSCYFLELVLGPRRSDGTFPTWTMTNVPILGARCPDTMPPWQVQYMKKNPGCLFPGDALIADGRIAWTWIQSPSDTALMVSTRDAGGGVVEGAMSYMSGRRKGETSAWRLRRSHGASLLAP